MSFFCSVVMLTAAGFLARAAEGLGPVTATNDNNNGTTRANLPIQPLIEVGTALDGWWQNALLAPSQFLLLAAGVSLALAAILIAYIARKVLSSQSNKKVPVQHWSNHALGFNKLRRETYPPAFPNGWFKLCDVSDLANGRIQNVSALGLNLIVFKSMKTSQPVVMDAFCPHLGAHLGVGGRVSDGGVVCPFHGWCIGETGHVSDIPYCTGTLPKNRVQRIHTHRVWMGMVMLWFHADNFSQEGKQFDEEVAREEGTGAASTTERDEEGEFRGVTVPQLVPPLYEMRPCHASKWNRFLTQQCFYNQHMIEVSQNAPDYFHFNFLHDTFNIHPWVNPITDRLLSISHETKMFAKDELKQDIFFTNYATVFLHLFGRKFTLSAMTQRTEVDFEGPAIVHFDISTPVGSLHLIKSLLPVDHFKIFIEDAWFCTPNTPRWLANFIAWTAEGALFQDKPIWENKIHLHKPHLVRGDGPFTQHRAWWAGFYSDSSERWAADHRVDAMQW